LTERIERWIADFGLMLPSRHLSFDVTAIYIHIVIMQTHHQPR
jgi:hypothetical protein